MRADRRAISTAVSKHRAAPRGRARSRAAARPSADEAPPRRSARRSAPRHASASVTTSRAASVSPAFASVAASRPRKYVLKSSEPSARMAATPSRILRQPSCDLARLSQRPAPGHGCPRLELDESPLAGEHGGRLGAVTGRPPVAAELVETGGVEKGVRFAERMAELRASATASSLCRLACSGSPESSSAQAPCPRAHTAGIVVAVDGGERRVPLGIVEARPPGPHGRGRPLSSPRAKQRRPQRVMRLDQEPRIVGVLRQSQQARAEPVGHVDLAAAPAEQEEAPEDREELRACRRSARTAPGPACRPARPRVRPGP